MSKKTIAAWVFAAFCAILALGIGFSASGAMGVIGCILMLATAVLSLPILPIEELWERILGNKPKAIKSVAIVVLLILALIFGMVGTESDTTETTDSASSSISEEVETAEATDETAEEATETEATTTTTSKETTTTTTKKTTTTTKKTTTTTTAPAVDLSSIPDYSSSPYVAINGNVPYFTSADYTTTSYESYSDLDSLGRCGVAIANVGQDIMPTEERGSIGSVKPTGWHSEKYDIVDGKYLYNRCHLIGYQLSGENANEKNLITGTRYLNVEGMLPFENMVADYVEETNNHVLYRVTPIFDGDNLLASGVLMEAYSVEDNGEGIEFCVYCYNVQPGIGIDYATGDSWQEESATTTTTKETTTTTKKTTTTTKATTKATTTTKAAADNTSSSAKYILNTNTMKFHLPTCSSVSQMSDSNLQEYTGSRESLIAQGYDPCGRCNP